MSVYDAADVALDQAGQIIEADVEAALYTLDQRRSTTHEIDDLQVAMTLTDDFMGSTLTSGVIGELGWATSSTGSGAVTVEIANVGPGVIKLGTGTTASSRMAIDLGNHRQASEGRAWSLSGCPVFVQETRCKLDGLDTATDAASVYIGLVGYQPDATPPSAHPVGCYFRYRTGIWSANCARSFIAAGRTSVPISVAPSDGWHRFRITSDGGGIVRFYVDGAEVARITTTVPVDQLYVAPVTHGPTIEIRKTLGTAARGLLVDYYTLRWEAAR